MALGLAQRGFRGVITGIAGDAGAAGMPAGELERRLLELGFTEGRQRSRSCTRACSAAIRSRCASTTPLSPSAAARPWPSLSADMSVVSSSAPLHFALIGTPNSGKTALFNALTGSRQKVANYPGVTVERKSGLLTDARRPQRQPHRPARHLFAARTLARRGSHPRLRARAASRPRRRPTCCCASPTRPICGWRCGWCSN